MRQETRDRHELMFMVISGAISLPRDGWNAERLRAGPRPTIRVLIIVDSDDDGGGGVDGC